MPDAVGPMARRVVTSSLDEAAGVLDALRRDAALIESIAHGARDLASCLRGGGKVLLCGNGGSLCDAAHFAEELTGRFRADRRPLPALACADPGHLTCTANDYGFEFVFSRWLEALARPGDTVVLLSTSGRSANLVHAAKAARTAGARVVALLGRGGGEVAPLCDRAITVPGEASDRIQELHMLILHAWVQAIEVDLGLSPG
jgi:D-sedoheptulose 7-phosphate isomerase